jgi:hypothetical protein
MAQTQQSDDYGGYDITTPEDIYNQQQTQYDREQANGNATQRALSNIRAGVQGMFGGGPQMDHAKAVQNQMKAILGETSAQADPNEDPLTTQMRVARAMATQMAPIAPQVAMQANAQMVKLQQAQKQQGLLDARTSQENTLAQEGQLKLAQQKASANYVVFDSGPGDDKLPSMKQYGDPISMYKDDGTLDPDFHTNIAAAIKKAKEDGAANPLYLPADSYTNGKGMVADTRAKAQIDATNARLAAKQQAESVSDPNVLKANVANALLYGPTGMRNIPKEERDATLSYMTSQGLSPFDGVPAQAEIKALNANATAQGRREGNVAFLAASVPALGQNVLDTMDKVDRTRFPLLNHAIIIGKDASGSPEERAYSAAIQGYVNEYARVISGGQNITSDAARQQAHALLSKADNPEAVKATLKLLSGKELDAIKGAGPIALEMLRNPTNYPTATKISNLLGFNSLVGFGLDQRANGTAQQIPMSFASEAEAEQAFKDKKFQAGDKITVGGKPGTWQ